VAVVPALCHQQMQALGTVCRPLVSGGIERQVGIYTRRRHALSSAANRMVELMLMQFE
jgi:LysR family transcriptional regulator, carnitine catabolism transcriptional activator